MSQNGNVGKHPSYTGDTRARSNGTESIRYCEEAVASSINFAEIYLSIDEASHTTYNGQQHLVKVPADCL